MDFAQLRWRDEGGVKITYIRPCDLQNFVEFFASMHNTNFSRRNSRKQREGEGTRGPERQVIQYFSYHCAYGPQDRSNEVSEPAPQACETDVKRRRRRRSSALGGSSKRGCRMRWTATITEEACQIRVLESRHVNSKGHVCHGVDVDHTCPSIGYKDMQAPYLSQHCKKLIMEKLQVKMPWKQIQEEVREDTLSRHQCQDLGALLAAGKGRDYYVNGQDIANLARKMKKIEASCGGSDEQQGPRVHHVQIDSGDTENELQGVLNYVQDVACNDKCGIGRGVDEEEMLNACIENLKALYHSRRHVRPLILAHLQKMTSFIQHFEDSDLMRVSST